MDGSNGFQKRISNLKVDLIITLFGIQPEWILFKFRVLRFFVPGLVFLGFIQGIQGQRISCSDPSRIQKDLVAITQTQQARTWNRTEILDQVAGYVFKELEECCDSVYYQCYSHKGKVFRNVIGSMGLGFPERIVVGAHYDVAGEQEGADDNASGVAGLLELARLLASDTPVYRIDFVAFTLEEPPFFGTEHMGSFIHARSLFNEKAQVKGMVCLEMIGYFSDKPGSQAYPFLPLKWFFGDVGNYISLIRRFGDGPFPRRFSRLMKRQKLLPVKSLTGFGGMETLGLSDHRNYWAFDFPAVMVTNTAFFRNPNYHQTGDRLETLDLQRMGLVIDQVAASLRVLGFRNP